MSCQAYIERSSTFTAIHGNLSEVCGRLKAFEDNIKPCPAPEEFINLHTGRHRKLSYVEYYDAKSIQFRCFSYSKLTRGDLVMRCLPNGTWSGTEAICTVIPLRSKWLIMGRIMFTCLMVAAFCLTADFMVWRKSKREKRDQKRNKILHLAEADKASNWQPIVPHPSKSKSNSTVDGTIERLGYPSKVRPSIIYLQATLHKDLLAKKATKRRVGCAEAVKMSEETNTREQPIEMDHLSSKREEGGFYSGGSVGNKP